MVPSLDALNALQYNQDLNYGTLARSGLLAHVMSDLFKVLKKTLGKFGARAAMRPLTAHNGKLGYNWLLGGKGFTESKGKVFNTSKYGELLKDILPKLKTKYPSYAAQIASKYDSANMIDPVV